MKIRMFAFKDSTFNKVSIKKNFIPKEIEDDPMLAITYYKQFIANHPEYKCVYLLGDIGTVDILDIIANFGTIATYFTMKPLPWIPIAIHTSNNISESRYMFKELGFKDYASIKYYDDNRREVIESGSIIDMVDRYYKIIDHEKISTIQLSIQSIYDQMIYVQSDTKYTIDKPKDIYYYKRYKLKG